VGRVGTTERARARAGAVSRLSSALKVRPGEGRVAVRVLAMMFVVWSGFAIGGNAVEGLLFARFGPDALPYLFVGLGFATAAVMLTMNMVLQRPNPQRLLVRTLPGMAVAVLGMRALLLFGARWLYPAMWLAMMVLWTAIGIVIWGVAGAVHDTRQAKRLFPLYGSALILGGVVGGVATAPLATWLGAENLLLLWAGSFGIAFLLARSALRAAGVRVATRSRAQRPAVSARSRLAEGLRSVRSSPLLFWMSVSIALLAILYFSLSFLFARAATARFPDADRLSGFLGLFMGLTSATALVLGLFVANRLFARFGLASMVVALALLYLGGFAVVASSMTFVTLFVFRFVQMVWVNGVWGGAWQSIYNVVPPERRDGTRAIVDGVALQAGVAAAGVILILADFALGPRAVALLGLTVAVLAAFTTWRLRGAYAGAVVDALRAGNPEVFLAEDEPFGGIRRDAAAISVVAGSVSDPDPAVRRVSMEILVQVAELENVPIVLERLRDVDPVVRTLALRGAATLGATVPADIALTMLRDEDPSVRLAAVETLGPWDGVRPEGDPLPSLQKDPDPHVRASAAAAVLRSGNPEPGGEQTLRAMAESPDPEWRAAAVAVLPERDTGMELAVSLLEDSEPVVRRAAISALADRASPQAAEALVRLLGDADVGVRAAAVSGLARMGDAALQPATAALSRTDLEAGAMRVLARLDGADPSTLRAYVARQVSHAVRYAGLLRPFVGRVDPPTELLAHSLRDRMLRSTVDALSVEGRFSDPVAIELAIDDLGSRDPARRANALEALDAVGEPGVVRPLLRAWEAIATPSGDPASTLAEILRDPDPWLRACGARAAAAHAELRPAVEVLARTDTDTLVRAASASAFAGEDRSVETLPTLSLMERIVFLRRVPLFVDLSPVDLKQVAQISDEHAYGDGDVIADQGEPGEEMYLIVSGDISVVVARDGEAPAEVARRSAGDSVGEMAVISRAPRMASLVAAGDVRTLVIDRARFERILRDRPEASLAVMGVLCDRLREANSALPEIRS
jgi:CRP/FNR family cyclic AMP-dependent transcriptional regulator